MHADQRPGHDGHDRLFREAQRCHLLKPLLCWYFGAPDLEGPEQQLRAELDEWVKLGKPVLFTEYGADTVMGFHDTTPVMYTEEYQSSIIR